MSRLFVLFIVSIILCASCFDVSEADLFEDYKEQVIIEANVNNVDSQYFVQVRKSIKPNQQGESEPVNDAIVYLSGNSGESELLERVHPGIYASNNIHGVPLSEYALRVRVDGVNYSAVETMEEPAEVHRIELIYLEEFVEEQGYYIKLYIDKNIETVKYYKLEVIENDSLYNSYNDIIVFNDSYIDDVLEYIVPYAFEIGDSVSINLHSISEFMSRYYYELSKQTNITFSNIQPPMQNPSNNLINNALGYFQVSSIASIAVVIQ